MWRIPRVEKALFFCYTSAVDHQRTVSQRSGLKDHDRKGKHVANIKSQKKRIRTAEKARVRNRAVRSELKTYVKKVRAAVDAGDKAAAQDAVKAACRKLDKAASKGIIHKNQAAKRKSGVQMLVNGMD